MDLLAVLAFFGALLFLVYKLDRHRIARRAEIEDDASGERVAVWGTGVGPAPGRVGEVIPADELPPVLTRTYAGKPDQLEVLRSADAEALAQRGYFPTSQSYLEGRWSGTAWVLAFAAFIFVIGIFIFVYMIAAKPAGTLTVIYERRDAPTPTTVPPRPAEPPPQPAQFPTQPGPSDPVERASVVGASASVGPAQPTKVCPDCAETVLGAAKICRFCRHDFSLDPLPQAPAPATPPRTERPVAFTVAGGKLVMPPGDWRETTPTAGSYRAGPSVAAPTGLRDARGTMVALKPDGDAVVLDKPGQAALRLAPPEFRWAECRDYPGIVVLVASSGEPTMALRREGG
jgi:hypothetical protein